jgi:hypothetical protein
MKRVICLLMVIGISTVVGAATGPTQTPPPGPGSDWTQENWNGAPPTQNGGMQFGGPMRGSQSMPGLAEFQQRMQDMQRQFQQMQAQAQANKEASIRQTLGANDGQWAQIKPRLDRIDRFKTEVNASIDPSGSLNGSSNFVSTTTPEGGSAAGGWVGGGFTMSGQGGPNGTRFQNWSSVPSGGSGEATRAGNLCRELNNLLQAANVPPGQVSQKIAALRQAREQARRELVRERKELRSLLNFRQEATLIVMGYLD